MPDSERERRVRERFVRETAEHQMTVRHDDGLYRHLRFQKPGTWVYGFDLVTWPGYLAVVGDAGDFMFARIADMFEFFGPKGARGGFEDERWGINPHYWSEKLQGPGHDPAREYAHEAFRARVLDWARDYCEWGDGEDIYPSLLIGALEREVLAGWTHHEHEARERLSVLEEEVGGFLETWEWDLREYNWQFLWCCWAIVWGIAQYRAATIEQGGSVANST
jgi:hypothetical protein